MNKDLFHAMHDIFHGGEFAYWISQQKLSSGAMKEYQKAREYFLEQTNRPTVKVR